MKTPREILLARHQGTEPKLDRIRHAVVAEIHNKETKTQSESEDFAFWCLCSSQALCRQLWLELIWPCRRTWAGLAAVWMALVVFNLTQTEPTRPAVAKSNTSPAELQMAFAEQQRLLAELIGPPPQPAPAEPPRRKPAEQPRSERQLELLCA
jgi:hypothetical protein